jgi:hypothetical protein
MADSSRKPLNKFTSVQTLMRDSGQNHNDSKGFGKILAHARILHGLDQTLKSIIEPALSQHCQVAEFHNHCLILVCSSATFAARIQMISQQLLDSFREEGVSGIVRMEIRIAPVNRPQPEIRQQRTLSSAALQALGRFASDSGDADIQAIFQKIKARRNRQ